MFIFQYSYSKLSQAYTLKQLYYILISIEKEMVMDELSNVHTSTPTPHYSVYVMSSQLDQRLCKPSFVHTSISTGIVLFTQILRKATHNKLKCNAPFLLIQFTCFLVSPILEGRCKTMDHAFSLLHQLTLFVGNQ